MKMTAGKASTGETGSREQQRHIMPIQRKSSLKWVLSWWVDLSIDKNSINSASAKFRFRIIQTSVSYLPPPPVNCILKNPNVSAHFSFILYHTEYLQAYFITGNPSALLHSCPSYPTNSISLKRCPCSSGGRCGKLFLNFSTIVFDPHICD